MTSFDLEIARLRQTITNASQRLAILEEATGSVDLTSVNARLALLEDNTGSAALTARVVTLEDNTGSYYSKIKTPTSGATYTVDSGADLDFILNVNTGFNNTLLLPSLASVLAGRKLLIKDFVGSASINNIIVTANGTDNIDEDKTLTIANNWASIGLYAGASRWSIT